MRGTTANKKEKLRDISKNLMGVGGEVGRKRPDFTLTHPPTHPPSHFTFATPPGVELDSVFRTFSMHFA